MGRSGILSFRRDCCIDDIILSFELTFSLLHGCFGLDAIESVAVRLRESCEWMEWNVVRWLKKRGTWSRTEACQERITQEMYEEERKQEECNKWKSRSDSASSSSYYYYNYDCFYVRVRD